ncbi:quinolinate synthase [Clostridium sp. W14A]|uniref:Quinolinate synthase n=1 Tax=Caproicibacter fermentans TaxID=2576756 RepID=A0A7G8TDT1_9FIRM|nr:quinolinate synthase NadA [Caproicibacter fermentans]OCN00828.1 quinolinate synthase [Clostridium sp. W14A]QNK41772.1 quinolinate synthase NadA [Caproicibacter fermentans]
MNDPELIHEINRLRKERDAVILAHNYQPPEIQEIADLVGDSFALSKAAAEIDRRVIVFCGVRFMAESAKILSPRKTVLQPAAGAGCPLADSVTVPQLRQAREAHPRAAVVCYINTSAAVKSECDICCTSSNAVRIARSVRKEEILFVPDCNLASYVAEAVPEKKVIPWSGSCAVHSRISSAGVAAARAAHPGAPLLVHPEVPAKIRNQADFTGSTAQIIGFAAGSDGREFIVGTEVGILEKLRSVRPDAAFYPLQGNLLCADMKKTTLQNVCDSLTSMKNEVKMPEELRQKAFVCLNRMMAAAEN